MKLDCKFKGLDYSESLVDEAKKRFEKLKRYELKPIRAHLTFSMRKHEKVVEVAVFSSDKAHKARAKAESFMSAIEQVVAKMSRQMERKKQRIQHYRHYPSSKSGKIQRLNESLETPEVVADWRKAG